MNGGQLDLTQTQSVGKVETRFSDGDQDICLLQGERRSAVDELGLHSLHPY